MLPKFTGSCLTSSECQHVPKKSQEVIVPRVLSSKTGRPTPDRVKVPIVCHWGDSFGHPHATHWPTSSILNPPGSSRLSFATGAPTTTSEPKPIEFESALQETPLGC